MPDLFPKLLPFGASLLTVRASRRLRQKSRGPAQQARALRALLPRLAATAHGRSLGLADARDYRAFRRQVAPRAYEYFAPLIARMMQGEADVLWPGRTTHYAVSSRTTAGPAKHLPVSAAMLAHFRRAGLNSLLYYTARVGHTGVFRGRHLHLGGATRAVSLPTVDGFEACAGDVCALTALNLPRWAERHLYEPGTAIAQMADWPAKLHAIAQRTSACDLTLIAGLPSWMLVFAEVLRTQLGSRAETLQSLWPNLECFVHGGVPIAPYADDLRTAMGPTIRFHEIYAASEAFIAAQDATPDAGLRLMTDAGIFYEFLPLRDFEPDRLAELGEKAVPLDGVQTGVDYALLLTTPAGLCRYLVGDVVRFTSVVPPRLVYVGRTQLQLNALGENVVEKDLTDALVAVCQRQQWTITNFHVAPLFGQTITGQTRGRHEWWLELRPGTVKTPTGPALATELDRELQLRNADYKARRHGVNLLDPVVRLLMPGVFESWLRHHGQWGGLGKMPRCRSDRLVADELAQIARFVPE
ncbi:GH3 auxin-responsive promoter family protein [Horticoccus luteus]|uniref:GH3 auxin-responsive promoter family protein n=1 Tax=Horticoccus luteus TaxID=2862869 RepID=A0A8F9XHJ3_9BACT|nr:GH3 auxin-responsive promoter family protein [Horticoccus luteus]QYM79390.1 GH3 auxin-responsive promoter family protein [Horticoccus luteus]